VAAVIDLAIRAAEAFGLDPEFIGIGAEPALAIPTEVAAGPAEAAFELIEQGMGENAIVVDGWHVVANHGAHHGRHLREGGAR
jgi:hypothetical protein